MGWLQDQYAKFDKRLGGYLPGGKTPEQIQAEKDELARLQAQAAELDRLKKLEDYNRLNPQQQTMSYDPNYGREAIENITPPVEVPAPIQYAQTAISDAQRLLLENAESSYKVAEVTGNALAAIPEYVGEKTQQVLETVPAFAEKKTESVSMPYQTSGTQYYDPNKGFYTPTAFEVTLPSVAETAGKITTNAPYLIPVVGEAIITAQGVKVIKDPNASLLQKGLGVAGVGLAAYGVSNIGRNILLAEDIAKSTTKFAAQVSEGQLGTTARVISQTKVGPTTYTGLIKEGSINVGKDMTVGSSSGLIIKDVNKVVPIDFISSRVQPYKDYFVSKTGGTSKIITTDGAITVGKDFGEGVFSMSKVKLIDGGYDTTKTIGGFKKTGENLYAFKGGDKPVTTFGKDTLFGSLKTKQNIQGVIQVIPKKEIIYDISGPTDDIYAISLKAIKEKTLKDQLIPTLTGTSIIGRYQPQKLLTYKVAQTKVPMSVFDRSTQESIIGQVTSQRTAALDFAKKGFKSTDQYFSTAIKGVSALDINPNPPKLSFKIDTTVDYKPKVTEKTNVGVIQPINLFKPKVIENVNTDIIINQKIDTGLDVKPKVDQMTDVIIRPDYQTKIETKIEPITQIITKPNVITRPDVTPRITPRIRPPTVIIPRPYIKLPPPTFSLAPAIKTKLVTVKTAKKRKKVLGGFDVQVKRKGQWISKGVSLSRQQAGLYAQLSLKKTLDASARLVPTAKAAEQSNISFAAKPGEFYQKGNANLFIQSRGSKAQGFSRLGSRSEVSEIMTYKKRKGGLF